MSEPLKVVVRYRPINNLELSHSSKQCVQKLSNQQISIFKDQIQKIFLFNQVFDEKSIQNDIYNNSAKQIIENINQGYNGTIFAYGQTGCGKTHTMMGCKKSDEGIIPRSFNQIMDNIQDNSQYEYLIHCQYIEIYNENVYDLTDKQKIKYDIKESPEQGFYIKNLEKTIVKDTIDLYNIIEKGNKNRQTGQTQMNDKSSRSHSLFILNVEVIQQNKLIKASRLNLVDLAGSEKISKSQVEDQNLKEAQKINQSLSALGNVIFALSDQKQHIPYRDSKLTKLLHNSLGGNSKTLMIACISPSIYNYDESLSTLRYAGRASKIINKPIINQDPKDALIKKYLQQINELKQQLNRKSTTNIQNQNIKIINNTQYNIQYNDYEKFSSIQEKIKQIKQRQSLLQQSQNSLLLNIENQENQESKQQTKEETIQKLNKILNHLSDIKIKPTEKTQETQQDFNKVYVKNNYHKPKVIQRNSIQIQQNEIDPDQTKQFQNQIQNLKKQIFSLQKENMIKYKIIQQFVPVVDYQYLKNNCTLKNNEVILPKLKVRKNKTNKSITINKQVSCTDIQTQQNSIQKRYIKSKSQLKYVKLSPIDQVNQLI